MFLANKDAMLSVPQKTSSHAQLTLSSTPHAPRRRKDLSNMISGSTGISRQDCADEGIITLPVDDKKHSLLPKQTAQAWMEEKHTILPSSTVVTVKPFRRTYGPKAPPDVPPLDLSRLNEPDEAMQSIELLPEIPETQRSNISWGSSPLRDRPERTVANSTFQETTARNEEQRASDQSNTQHLQPHVGFVEERMLSHERCKAANGTSSTQCLSKEGMLNNLVLGSAGLDSILSKRVPFSARLFTQNGYCVHKKLYGFFFLTDNSIAIYEFRKIGPRSSALPIIQRSVYYHQLGSRKGQPYQINSIRKGMTLYFNRKDHPALPSYGDSRIFGVRVTCVDENIKKQTLSLGQTLAEQRALDDYLKDGALELNAKDKDLLQTIQTMLRSRLQGRASKTLVGLGRYLSKNADSKCIIGKGLLQQSLRSFHIGLTHEDFENLWRVLMSTASCNSDGLFVDGAVLALVGEMSEDRKAIITMVFQKLDSRRTGIIALDEMHKFFNPNAHPDVIEGNKSAEEAWFALFNCLCPTINDTTVTYRDFEHYYEGVSIETKSDSAFISAVKNYWCLR